MSLIDPRILLQPRIAIDTVGWDLCGLFGFESLDLETWRCAKLPVMNAWQKFKKWFTDPNKALKKKEKEAILREMAIRHSDVFDSFALAKVLFPLPRMPSSIDEKDLKEILRDIVQEE